MSGGGHRAIEIRLGSEGGRAGARYAVAGLTVLSDTPLEALAALRTGDARLAPAGRPRAVARGEAGPLVQWPSWLCGGWRQLGFWRHGDRYLLRVAGVAGLVISGSDRVRMRRDPSDGLDDDGEGDGAADALLRAAAVGPGLVAGLAFYDVFCLHAGAIELDGGAVALAGESGAGKSTLAAFLADRWPRLADDVLPVAIAGDGAVALPHFPQPKLDRAAQVPVQAPPALPLRAVIVLAPAAASAAPELTALSGVAAAAALLRHAMGARLFPPARLGRQLDAVAAIAEHARVYRLRYPRSLAALPAIGDGIERAVRGRAGRVSRVDR